MTAPPAAGIRAGAPGLASAAVTLGIALFFFFSATAPRPAPPPSEQETPAPEAPAPAQARTVPAPAPVVLPPPPEPAAPAKPARVPAPALAPKPASAPVSTPKAAPSPPHAIVPLKPRPRPAETSPPKSISSTAAAPASVAAPVAPAPATVKQGRALLRLLENGKGPSVEIAWPADAAGRARLYDRLTACYGMKTVLLAANGDVYTANGPPGRALQVDRDRTSGFVRRPEGAVPAAERSLIERIRARNGGPPASPARLFPRAVDAALLGALSAAAGPGWMSRSRIRARYRLTGGRVAVDDIAIDGTPVPGAVALPTTGGPGCR